MRLLYSIGKRKTINDLPFSEGDTTLCDGGCGSCANCTAGRSGEKWTNPNCGETTICKIGTGGTPCRSEQLTEPCGAGQPCGSYQLACGASEGSHDWDPCGEAMTCGAAMPCYMDSCGFNGCDAVTNGCGNRDGCGNDTGSDTCRPSVGTCGSTCYGGCNTGCQCNCQGGCQGDQNGGDSCKNNDGDGCQSNDGSCQDCYGGSHDGCNGGCQQNTDVTPPSDGCA